MNVPKWMASAAPRAARAQRPRRHRPDPAGEQERREDQRPPRRCARTRSPARAPWPRRSAAATSTRPARRSRAARSRPGAPAGRASPQGSFHVHARRRRRPLRGGGDRRRARPASACASRATPKARCWTSTRARCRPHEAAARVRRAGRIDFKKIDSQLRGNVAAELAALTGAVIVAPALPVEGRVVRGGVLYVDGEPRASPVRAHRRRDRRRPRRDRRRRRRGDAGRLGGARGRARPHARGAAAAAAPALRRAPVGPGRHARGGRAADAPGRDGRRGARARSNGRADASPPSAAGRSSWPRSPPPRRGPTWCSPAAAPRGRCSTRSACASCACSPRSTTAPSSAGPAGAGS